VRAALTAAAAGLLLLAGAGCGERGEPVGATVDLYPVTVQGVGDPLTVLRAPPQRIAAVAGTPARMLQALAAGGLLVGERLGALSGPPLVSALRRLHPDLIVASSESDSTDLGRAGRATGAPVYVTPDTSILQVERAIDDLGLLTGRGFQARKVVAKIQQQQKAVAAKLAGTSPVRVFIDTGFFSTVGDRTLLGDLVRKAGGANVAGTNPESGPIDLAELQTLHPDVYLATSDSGTTLRKLRANPQTRSLPAVLNGRFAIVPVALTQPGARIGEGLDALARMLHPDAFR
jgi:iron complex transport system substrate-binding protein